MLDRASLARLTSGHGGERSSGTLPYTLGRMRPDITHTQIHLNSHSWAGGRVREKRESAEYDSKHHVAEPRAAKSKNCQNKYWLSSPGSPPAHRVGSDHASRSALCLSPPQPLASAEKNRKEFSNGEAFASPGPTEAVTAVRNLRGLVGNSDSLEEVALAAAHRDCRAG